MRQKHTLVVALVVCFALRLSNTTLGAELTDASLIVTLSIASSTTSSSGSDGRVVSYPATWSTREGSDGRIVAFPSTWSTKQGSDGRVVAYPSGISWTTRDGSDGRVVAYPSGISWTTLEGSDGRRIALPPGATYGRGRDGRVVQMMANGPNQLLFADASLVVWLKDAVSQVGATDIANFWLYHFVNDSEQKRAQAGVLSAPTWTGRDIGAEYFYADFNPVPNAADYLYDVSVTPSFITFESIYQNRITTNNFAGAIFLVPNTTYWIRVRARSGSSQSAWSLPISIVTLKSQPPPIFSSQPSNNIVAAGASATFGASVAFEWPQPTFSWQRSPNGGTIWETLSTGLGFQGVNSQFLTTPPTTQARPRSRPSSPANRGGLRSKQVARSFCPWPRLVRRRPRTLGSSTGP